MVSLLLQAEPGTELPRGLPTTHALFFYEEEGKERAAAAVTATPVYLRALGGLHPGQIAIIRYDYASNMFYGYAYEGELFRGNFVAPPAFRELLTAEYERRGLPVWCPRPTETPTQ